MTLARSAKHVFFATARALGVTSVVAGSPWRGRRLLILCYHGVSQSDEHRWDGDLYVSSEFLRARLAHLRRRRCNILPLGEALDLLHEGRLPPRAVAVTFDDGWADFSLRAYPLLREFDCPATVYLYTAYVDVPQPVWPPVASYILWKAQGRAIDGQGLTADGNVLRTATSAERAESVQRMHARMRSAGIPERSEAARSLAERAGMDYEALRATRVLQLMTADEVAKLDPAMVDVQLHTHRHFQPEDRERFTAEIVDNRAAIMSLVRPPQAPRHFCYPSGNVRPEFPGWLASAGVVSATTCDAGLAAPGHDAMRLPRFVDTMRVNDVEFDAWLSGIPSLLPRRGRA